MSDLLKKVAQLLGVPESLIQRSSEARAEASGKSTEEVLQSWSGGEAVESAEEEVVEEVLVPAKNENTKAISAIMVAAMLFSGIFTLTIP